MYAHCNMSISLYMDIPDCRGRRNNSNARWGAHKHTVRTCIQQLTINQRWHTERPTAILVTLRWDCNHRQHLNEKQNNNSVCSTTRLSIKTAAHEPHGNREGKTDDIWVHILDQHECWHRETGKNIHVDVGFSCCFVSSYYYKLHILL